MILSDGTIVKLQKQNHFIKPFSLKNLQPCSYDFTLNKTGKTPAGEAIDLENFKLEPGDFILASTNEVFELPDWLCGEVKGKSSIGRLGLIIENAGHIDPGFIGQITLELANISKEEIDLSKFIDKPFGQIKFQQLDHSACKPYDGHYQNQEGVTESWIKNE